MFDDFLRFPKLRDSLAERLEELNDLRDISRFQKDTEASSLWKLINRLREIDGYVNWCVALMASERVTWFVCRLIAVSVRVAPNCCAV